VPARYRMIWTIAMVPATTPTIATRAARMNAGSLVRVAIPMSTTSAIAPATPVSTASTRRHQKMTRRITRPRASASSVAGTRFQTLIGISLRGSRSRRCESHAIPGRPPRHVRKARPRSAPAAGPALAVRAREPDERPPPVAPSSVPRPRGTCRHSRSVAWWTRIEPSPAAAS
jgi:hypothetical protein